MKRVLPPVYFLGAIVLALALHFFMPLRQLMAYPWRLAGLAPLVMGVLVILIAAQSFKKHGTTVKPFEESSALVTGGVFGLSRNPMYLSMVLFLLGIVLCLGSLSPFAAVVVLPIVLGRVFIPAEERMLEQKFGDEFRAYRKRVRRWM